MVETYLTHGSKLNHVSPATAIDTHHAVTIPVCIIN